MEKTIFSRGSETASPVCWPSPHPFLCRGVQLHRVQRGGRVRPCSLWWLLGPRLVGGELRRRRVRDDGFMEAYDIEVVGRGEGRGVRGLASPHPTLGAICGHFLRALHLWQLVRCLGVDFWKLFPYSALCLV